MSHPAANFAPKTTNRASPDELQQRASDPAASVWVGASAGTGKTKVLTDRVLRLLLPRGPEQPGSPAHKILCLTFTKAGAGEMAERIASKLAKWAVLSENNLTEELQKLLGRPAEPHEISAARALFAEVIDTPGGLQIMTIHSFCQSVLGRFPLESNLSPGFTVLDENQSADLLAQARLRALSEARKNPGSKEANALDHIAAVLNEDQFTALLQNAIAERGQLRTLFVQHFGAQGLYTNLCKNHNIAQTENPKNLMDGAFQDNALDFAALKNAAQILIERGSPRFKDRGQTLANWLTMNPQDRLAHQGTYRDIFINSKNEIRSDKDTASKDALEAIPALHAEAARLLELEDKIKAAEMALLTRDLLVLAEAVLRQYETLKSRTGGLDYDDLILHTLRLLKGESMKLDPASSARWVQYKLDQGLDHILIDEAQDTNPEQWDIIKALCDEFFAGESASEQDRSIFTVGDEKQSIYSFQRASPKAFHEMQAHFEQKVKESGKKWDLVPMQESFRSSRAVLGLVDAVFADPAQRQGLSKSEIEHIAHRAGQEGLAELWPLFESDQAEPPSLWNPEPETADQETASAKLARFIAQKIRGWIDNKDILPAHNRPIRAGDIMILVRTRKKMVQQISKALKDLEVPVSGLDRMILNDQLAVQDLLALAAFALQPRDDLSLACALKSPLIGLDEDTLYALAADRGSKSLWQMIRAAQPGIAAWLDGVITRSKTLSPYAFFNALLLRPCPGDPHSGRRAMTARLGLDATDALDVFMNAAIAFEMQHTLSLQDFLHHQKHNQAEIKREQESGIDAVRIMTVHGSKGLQAPIVILPDTVEAKGSSNNTRGEKRLLWPSQTDLNLPLWSPKKDYDPALYTRALSALGEKHEQESRRLLYVALTRAEDRIYIAGANSKKGMKETSWYELVRQGFTRAPGSEETEDGRARLYTPMEETAKPDKQRSTRKAQQQPAPLPDWALQLPEEEKGAERLINPSLATEIAASPLAGDNTRRFLRGNLTHKLLQLLPGLPPERHEASGATYLARYGAELAKDTRQSILGETLAILHAPEFAALFSPKAQAEVPISGRIAGTGLISGQIDRLLVDDNAVLIIDYKTNRPPPNDPKDIPEMYRAQMRLYAGVLAQIYPDKEIKAYLLWTDGPRLMRVDLGI